MKISNSFNSSVLFLLLNKFPTTGTLPNPGVFVLVLLMVFFLIPPITTISPSLTKSFVVISFVEIPGSSAPAIVFGASLLTWISNRTFPSPMILGVTVKESAASLNSVVVVPSEVVW